MFYYALVKNLYRNFVKGEIRKPYDRTTLGVGYTGCGIYKTGVDAFNIKGFSIWHSIIDRGYNEKMSNKYPAYEKSYVCDAFLNYQKFREWFDDKDYQIANEQMHIDKDILYKNNKFYAPQLCLIVPKRINMLFVRGSLKPNMPTRVRKSGTSYSSSYCGKNLGSYKTIEEAAIVHDIEKKYIQSVADKYR